jgi:hypothetical protein
MAATSSITPYNGLQEKGNHRVQRSSSDKSDKGATKEAYDEKDGIPVQDSNLSDDASSDSVKEVFDVEAIDSVLSKKMQLVNKAIDEIGMTSFQWKMFFLSGFGYAVDSVCRSWKPLFSRLHCCLITYLTLQSFLSSANQLQIQLFNKNTGCRVPTFREFHWHPKSAFSWEPESGDSRPISSDEN